MDHLTCLRRTGPEADAAVTSRSYARRSPIFQRSRQTKPSSYALGRAGGPSATAAMRRTLRRSGNGSGRLAILRQFVGMTSRRIALLPITRRPGTAEECAIRRN